MEEHREGGKGSESLSEREREHERKLSRGYAFIYIYICRVVKSRVLHVRQTYTNKWTDVL